jgi:hypothetical protein
VAAQQKSYSVVPLIIRYVTIGSCKLLSAVPAIAQIGLLPIRLDYYYRIVASDENQTLVGYGGRSTTCVSPNNGFRSAGVCFTESEEW